MSNSNHTAVDILSIDLILDRISCQSFVGVSTLGSTILSATKSSAIRQVTNKEGIEELCGKSHQRFIEQYLQLFVKRA